MLTQLQQNIIIPSILNQTIAMTTKIDRISDPNPDADDILQLELDLNAIYNSNDANTAFHNNNTHFGLNKTKTAAAAHNNNNNNNDKINSDSKQQQQQASNQFSPANIIIAWCLNYKSNLHIAFHFNCEHRDIMFNLILLSVVGSFLSIYILCQFSDMWGGNHGGFIVASMVS